MRYKHLHKKSRFSVKHYEKHYTLSITLFKVFLWIYLHFRHFLPFYFILFLFSVPAFIVYAPHQNIHHQAHPTPNLSPPKPSVCFSESIVSHGLSPSLIFPHSLLSISWCPPCYSLCFTSKWNHMIIDFLCLTFFTQHNLFQSCPCWYKSWVFILSDGVIILRSVYGPHLPYPFICWMASWFSFLLSFHSLVKIMQLTYLERGPS